MYPHCIHATVNTIKTLFNPYINQIYVIQNIVWSSVSRDMNTALKPLSPLVLTRQCRLRL